MSLICDISVKVDGRQIEDGWTESVSTLATLDLAVLRVREHIQKLGIRPPAKIEIVIGEQ